MGIIPLTPLAARGKSPPAFERRCIPPDCVARRSNMLDILAPRALPGGRIGALGASPDFCHGLLARIFHQSAYSFSESHLFSFNFITTLGRCGGDTVRWPRSRLSFAPVRVHARSTIGWAMLPLASTRTGAKSGAIFAALGEICGLARGEYLPYCQGLQRVCIRGVPPRTARLV